MAHAHSLRELQPQRRQPDQRGRAGDCGAEVRHFDSKRLAQRQGQPSNDGAQLAAIERADWWQSEPDVGRVANGVAARVDRLKAIGNGQVPLCAATAWQLLTETA
jgi:DNA (cytosine-5)-methyltransferase 1